MAYNNTHILGTIISSVLDYDNMCIVTGDPGTVDNTKSIWIPCDGRDITNSTLAKKTGVNTSPDLRGKFMRGLNIIHREGQPPLDITKSDPEGLNRVPGSYQPDAFKQHSHSYNRFSDGVITDMSDDKDHRRCSYGSNAGSGTGATGDSKDETRPKNISVYYYLKIN
jgi:hypothetical protein